jgi:hypothetical protein
MEDGCGDESIKERLISLVFLDGWLVLSKVQTRDRYVPVEAGTGCCMMTWNNRLAPTIFSCFCGGKFRVFQSVKKLTKKRCTTFISKLLYF